MHYYFIPFYGRRLFHCMYIPHLAHPFISLDCLHFWVIIIDTAVTIYVQVLMWTCVFNSLGYASRRTISGSHDNSVLNILRTCQTFQTHHFTFPSAMYEVSNVSTSSPILVITCLFYYTYPSGCELVSHCPINFSSLILTLHSHYMWPLMVSGYCIKIPKWKGKD